MLDRPGNRHDDTAFPAELMIWLSPAFPVGGFAYSQGLENTVARGLVSDATSLADWLMHLTEHGSLRNDLIFISLVQRAPDTETIDELSELALAMQPSRERAEEAAAQGAAFRDAYNAAWADDGGHLEGELTLAVAVGRAARAYGVSLSATLTAHAISFATNLISAAIRLSVIGQTDGQRVLAMLLPRLQAAAASAITASKDDLGSATFAADLASIHHETQNVRLFRS